MKRSLLILCTIALMLSLIASWNVYAVEEETVCPYCGRTQSEFIELTNDLDRFLVAGHYYMTGDVSRPKQLILEAEGVSCLDLAGHTLSGTGRAMQIGEDVAKPNVVLNIYDSVGGGVVKGKGSTSNSWNGGTIWQEPGATINLHSGTLTTYDTATQTAGKGAVAIVKGNFNVYGGNIIGGTAYSFGGALWIADGGALKLAGGTVTAGTAPDGPCVYAHTGSTVTLSGDARVDDIAFNGTATSANVVISGKYTGKAQLTLGELASGAAIAVSDNADISGAALTVAGSTLTPMVSGDSIIVGEGSWCEACQRNVTWTNVTDAYMDSITVFSAGHYRLTENVTTTQMSLKNMTGTVCLDLNGFSYTSTGRAFLLENPTDSTVKNTLNIMDSSENETGVLVGMGGSEAMASGIIRSYKNTVLNIYSGTLKLDDGGKVSAKDGGVMQLSGAANMYGGTLIGGKVARWGGAVSVGSGAVFTMAGGKILSGEAGDAADCVYVASGGKVKLQGDACPEQILFADASIGNITLIGDYTGNTEFGFVTMPAAGADIGNCENATLGKESIAITGTRNFVTVSGTDLVSTSLKGAVADGIYCDTLAEALTKGTNIRLLADNAENVTITQNVVLDLAGYDLTGNVTVTGGTLFVKDSATDDHTVEDVCGYGKLSGSLSGNVVAADGYLTLTEADGISYHHYILKLKSVSLRPGKAGIYYKSDILVNGAVLGMIERYGVAVSTGSQSPSADPKDSLSRYTAFTKNDYGLSGTTSAMITGIMDGENSDGADANTLIYGRPYILLTDGTYLYGEVAATSLKALTERIITDKWEDLTITQNRAIHAMYETYETVMKAWPLPALQKAVMSAKTAADDGVFKAMIIGNSDSTDATNLLYEIFLAEGWKKEELVLGCMYESGCAISSHVKFAQNNMAEYKYYKNTGANADGSWDCRENSTLEYALQDENWDVVILQESNSVSGVATHFENNPDVESLITYVVNTLGYEPTLLWHFVGANPQIPEPYMSYVLSQEDADGDNSDASENEGWEDTGVDEPEDLVWIFDIARPSAPVAWAKRYQQYWNNDREVMYNAIADNVEKYILGSDVYGFDGVIPSATSFQYAINNLGMTERDMYRDYTHKSDYGRVMVSYVWYAILTGKTEITDIKYTTVAANMRQKKFVQYGDLVLTDEQVDVLLESVNHALSSPLEAPSKAAKALDGKKVIFFGNSHLYYGRTVLDKGQSATIEDRVDDQGLFYQFCKANGINVSVTNYTFGEHELADFYSGSCAAGKGHDGYNHLEDIGNFDYDYVILQQGTKDPENDLVGDVQKMKDLFTAANPDVQVIFLVHQRAYTNDYAWLTKVKELESIGVTVVDWGGMLDGIVNSEITIPGAKQTYDQSSFIISKSASDGYHPNLLTGYITTLMTYCAITGEKAEGQHYYLGADCPIIGNTALANYRSTYYTYNTETNFDTVLRSGTEMTAIQKLIDQYMAAKSYRDYQ